MIVSNTELCHCAETQTMSHIVDCCQLMKLNSTKLQLHSVQLLPRDAYTSAILAADILSVCLSSVRSSAIRVLCDKTKEPTAYV